MEKKKKPSQKHRKKKKKNRTNKSSHFFRLQLSSTLIEVLYIKEVRTMDFRACPTDSAPVAKE